MDSLLPCVHLDRSSCQGFDDLSWDSISSEPPPPEKVGHLTETQPPFDVYRRAASSFPVSTNQCLGSNTLNCGD